MRGYHGSSMNRIGDRDRDRVAASLRRHYLQGRLSVEEFAERTELTLRARSDRDLRLALHELPSLWRSLDEIVGPAAKAAAQTAARAVVLLALMSFWGFLSLVLLLAFAIALLINGPSLTEVVGFPLAWLGLTYGLWRVWQRSGERRA